MSTKIEFFINDQPVQCEPGTSVIAAADQAGIYIPRFCYHDKLSVVANCRMCLVDIENAPKTLPACATPVTPGMKVYTQSAKTRESQKAVMAFLLINHPLDCPICDQGGECELQDIAMGYGESESNFTKRKRVVQDEDLGPLVATEMTRCIHCTRCVRFGQEIAGIAELGEIDRGGHMNISTYLKRGLRSELSGNVIDLCPVGALTSKPYRFHGRSWEFTQHDSIAPHDCVGSNIYVHTVNTGNDEKIMRVIPKQNEAINEVWLSDRDRFGYEGLKSPSRLTQPAIKIKGKWFPASWQDVLNAAKQEIEKCISAHEANDIAALVHPSSTTEEMFVLKQWMTTLGCPHVDHRLKALDTSDQAEMPTQLGLPFSLSDLEDQSMFLVIGAQPRQEQPLFNHRLRKAVLRGAACEVMHYASEEWNYPLSGLHLVPYAQWAETIASLTHAAYLVKKCTVPSALAPFEPSKKMLALAKKLAKNKKTCVLLGCSVHHHPQASVIRRLMRDLCQVLDISLGYLTEGANQAGGHASNCLPAEKKGLSTKQLWEQPRKLYWLHNVELEDCSTPHLALSALQNSFVIACNRFDSDALRDYADIILPICPYTEMAGSFVNISGEQQRFQAALQPMGESIAGWKVITALAQLMGLTGFDYSHSQAVADAFNQLEKPTARDNTLPKTIKNLPHPHMWVSPVHPYRADDILRHAPALQATIEEGVVRMNPQAAKELKLTDASRVDVCWQGQSYQVPLVLDDHVADKTWIIPNDIAQHLPLNAPIDLRKTT